MATIIYTGDPKKCRVLNMLECPACGAEFEILDGVSKRSATLGDEVLVCPKHADREFDVMEEIAIQDAMRKAAGHPRGRVQKNGKYLKQCQVLDEIGYKPGKA